jgi:hypothetical protein
LVQPKGVALPPCLACPAAAASTDVRVADICHAWCQACDVAGRTSFNDEVQRHRAGSILNQRLRPRLAHVAVCNSVEIIVVGCLSVFLLLDWFLVTSASCLKHLQCQRCLHSIMLQPIGCFVAVLACDSGLVPQSSPLEGCDALSYTQHWQNRRNCGLWCVNCYSCSMLATGSTGK